jgi:hypothetical protein
MKILLIVSSLDLNPRLQTGRGFSRFFVPGLTPSFHDWNATSSALSLLVAMTAV